MKKAGISLVDQRYEKKEGFEKMFLFLFALQAMEKGKQRRLAQPGGAQADLLEVFGGLTDLF